MEKMKPVRKKSSTKEQMPDFLENICLRILKVI